MPRQNVAKGYRAPSHGRSPAGARRREVDLSEHQIDEAIDEVVFAGQVAIERHRGSAQVLGEVSDREGVEATRIGLRPGSAQDPLPAEGGPRRDSWFCPFAYGHPQLPGSP